jgi:hypothetical protein
MEEKRQSAILEASKECADAADVCWDVGDPVFDDLFVDILKRLVITTQQIYGAGGGPDTKVTVIHPT